jgi:hypothetical protein
MKPVGPTPLPEHTYSARQLPVKRVLQWVIRVLVGIGIGAAILVLFVVSLYRTPSGTPLLHMFGRSVPLPAARVDNQAIYYREFIRARDGWNQYYVSAGTIDAIDMSVIEQRLINRMIDHHLTEEIAEELMVGVSDDDLEPAYVDLVGQHDSEAHFIDQLEKRFGWDRPELEKYVLRPITLARAVDIAIRASEEEQRDPRQNIDQMRLDVSAGGQSFSELASQYSASLSASEGGELGLSPVEEYPEEAYEALSLASIDDLTAVIETSERFVVYKIIEREQRPSGLYINAQELSVEKRDIHDVISERRNNANIKIFIN